MLLAIDTATRYASLALYDGTGIISEQTWYSQNNHSVEMLPAIDGMLSRQGLTPNDGLCLALDIPIVAIPTLDIITYAAGDPGGPVLAVLQAGRGRLCVGTYRFEEGLPVQDGGIARVKESEWVVETEEPVLITGEVSADLVERILAQPNADKIAISSLAGSLRRAGYLAELAWDMLQDGQADDLNSLSPIYLHDPASGTSG